MNEFAITVTAREHAELLPCDAPTKPLGENEVEGHTVATAVSPGTELAWNYTGKEFPGTPGYAAIFKVERLGAAVNDLQPGQLVFATGGHRSFQRHTRNRVAPVPDGLDPLTGVLTRLMGISFSTLVTTTARPPAQVVVTGLGPVGNLAAQIFNVSGYRVTAVDPVEKRRGLLSGTGITLLPALPVDDPQCANKVALVVDCSGHEAAVLDACKLVRKRGEVVLIGVPWRKRTDLTAHALLHEVFHRYVVLRSGWEWEVPMDATDFRTGSIMENFAAGMAWLQQGKIRTQGFNDVASPQEATRVYADLFAQRSPGLTTVFDWRMLRE